MIGHATALLEFAPPASTGANGAGKPFRALTDPMFSERASPLGWLGPRRMRPPGLALADLPPLDAILLSHDHYDHLDAASLRALSEGRDASHASPATIVPLGLGRLVKRVAPTLASTELDWWDEAPAGPPGARLHVTATPAQHWSNRGPGQLNRSLWCGFVIRDEATGLAAYFPGDTGYSRDMFREVGQRLGPFDLVMLPIGAYDPDWMMQLNHMNPEEAVEAYGDLGRQGVLMAIHHGTFRLTDEPVDEPAERLRAAWNHAGLPESLLWIPAPGELRDIAK